MRNIFIIPLKKTSQRIPGKNFRMLGDKPLFRWVHDKLWELLREHPDLATTVAIFGGDDIRELVPDGTLWIRETKVTARQDANRMLRDMVVSTMAQTNSDYDAFTHVNCTSPFTDPELYRKCVDALALEGYDSACTAVELRGRFWKRGVDDEPDYPINHDPGTCPRTQLQSPLIMESDACWIMRAKVVLEANRRVSTHHKFIPVSGLSALDIDNPADFTLAEAVVRSGACPNSSS